MEILHDIVNLHQSIMRSGAGAADSLPSSDARSVATESIHEDGSFRSKSIVENPDVPLVAVAKIDLEGEEAKAGGGQRGESNSLSPKGNTSFSFGSSGTPKASASASASASGAAVGGGGASAGATTSSAVANEVLVLDALVALRLSIALMHARKKNASLIRSRSLTMEIIKIFTLKQNDSSRWGRSWWATSRRWCRCCMCSRRRSGPAVASSRRRTTWWAGGRLRLPLPLHLFLFLLLILLLLLHLFPAPALSRHSSNISQVLLQWRLVCRQERVPKAWSYLTYQ
jgi:hypothetical protein